MTKQEQEPTRLWLGVALSLIGYVFFVTASSLVWSFKGRFSTIQIIFIQNIVSLFCIAPVALRNGLSHLQTKVLPIHLMRDVFGVLSYYLFFLAIRFLNLVDATVLNYTAPFFVPVIWWIWMREKVGRHVWWSIIIGFMGIAIILNPSRQIFQLGFVLGIFAGILSAVAFVSLRILNLHREPMSRTLFYYFLTGTILSAPFAWIYWVHPAGYEWLSAIGIGVATAAGQMLLTIAYRYGTASYLSPLGYSTVIYAALISWIIFDRTPSFRSLIGTLLIIIGGTITYVLKKKPSNLAETFETPAPKEKPPL
jgi:drug/metabolite transporter (DMT)-like permease